MTMGLNPDGEFKRIRVDEEGKLLISGQSTTAAWGDLGGDIENQTDLQDELGTKADTTALTAHTSSKSNPHETTKAQVGLGNVDNTSDVNKPVSTAQQTALDGKLDKTGGTIAGDLKVTNRLNAGATTLETEQAIALAIEQTVYGGAGIVGRNKHSPVLAERLGFFLFGGAGNNTSGMSSNATETWTAAARGSNLLFEVTPNGSAGRTAALKIEPDRTAIFFGHSTPNSDNLYELGTPLKYWANLYTKQADIGGVKYISGYGFPNGVTPAPVGSIYIDRAMTNGASSWIKKSGTGNTGWQVLEGDTGWRRLEGYIDTTSFSNTISETQYLLIRRVNNTVSMTGRIVSTVATTGGPRGVLTPAGLAALNGFKSLQAYAPIVSITGANGWNLPGTAIIRSSIGASADSDAFAAAQFTSGVNLSINFTWTTTNNWPSTLPGTAS